MTIFNNNVSLNRDQYDPLSANPSERPWNVICACTGESLMVVMMKGMGEWGRWVTSVNPHSALPTGLTTKWPRNSTINLTSLKLHGGSKELSKIVKSPALRNSANEQYTYCTRHIHKKVRHLVLSVRLYACENVSLIWGVILLKSSTSPVEK